MKNLSKALSITLILALIIAILPPPPALASPDTTKTEYGEPAIDDRGGQLQQTTADKTGQQTPLPDQQTGDEPYQIPDIIGEETDLRTETGTSFRNADGTSVAVDYGYPINYKDSPDGAWKQMDYSLVDKGERASDGTKEYSLKAAPNKVKVIQTLKSGQALSTEVSGHSISWGYSDIATTTAEVASGDVAITRDADKLAKIEEKAAKEAGKKVNSPSVAAQTDKSAKQKKNDKFTELPALTSSSYCADIYPDIDVDYAINPLGVKDNIILKSDKAKNEFTSVYDIGDLAAKQVDGKTITLSDSAGKLVATLSAPYMTDSAGEISYDLTFSLIGNTKKGKLTVKLSADKKWLKDVSRVYPVVIDPMLQTIQTKYQQAYVASGQATTTHPYGDMYIGYDGNAYKVARGYLRFDFPKIPVGSIVVAANLRMYQHSYSAVPATASTTYTLQPVTDNSWTANTLTWNNKPAYSSTVSDYTITSSSNNGKNLDLDVTKLVKDTLETSTASTKQLSVMIKGKNETTTQPYANVRLLTANYPGLPTAAQPFVYFFFRDTKGLEDYYSYTTASAGSAGTAYVNDYTGNLVFEHADVATSGLRMPVALSSYYNSDITDDYRPGLAAGEVRHGRGWRFNYLQQVQTTAAIGFSGDTAAYPYVYTDGDATMHYFYKSGTQYLDEDGLNLELKKPATGYTITDKKGTIMTFNAAGYLTEIKDANGNAATVSYVSGSNRISQIKDGVGHTLAFDAPLNSNGNAYLSTITDPAGRVTSYSNSDGRMTQVKYPDKTVSKYEYDANGRLYHAISADGTGLEITYKSDGSVSQVRQYGGTAASPMSTKGLSYRFDRSKHNTTVVEGPGVDGMLSNTAGDAVNTDNTFTTLQFDNWGRTVSSITKVGTTILGAGSSAYTKGNEASATDIGKRNLVTSSSTMARNSVNLCVNPGAEAALGSEWTNSLLGSSGTSALTRTNADKYQGAYSLRLVASGATSSSGARAYQRFTTDIKGGSSYTFSADVKTSGVALVSSTPNRGAALRLYAYSPAGNTSVFSEYLTGTTDTAIDNGWRRIYVTQKMPDDVTMLQADIVVYGANGTAYFDNMQLEPASVLNACNLMENASFERGSGIAPTKWSGVGLDAAAGDGLVTTSYQNLAQSFRIVGDPATNKEVKQDIVVSGASQDTYILSGWGDTNAGSINRADAKFEMIATVTYAGGTTKDRATVTFNPCVGGWQFASGAFTLGTGASSTDLPAKVTVRLRYCKEANNSYFDNIQVIKDSAPTYTYDANGNLISVSANAQNNSSMTYTNNDLTKYTDAKGYAYTYTYDTKHNMTQAKSQTGTTYNYGAFSYGNPTTLDVENPSATMSVKTSLTYTGASGSIAAGGYVASTSDQNGNADTYTYDQQKGLMTSSKNRVGATTSYSYNANTDQLTSLSSGSATASYGYADNRLNTVTHNGFSYNLSYDAYGNVLETKVGSQSLSKHTYTGQDGSLASETYGNGDVVQYTYNNYGSVSAVKKGNATTTPATKYSWSYDNSGTAYKHTDSVSGITYQYRYDSIGRIISQRAYTTSTGATRYETQYGYDNNNNVTKLTNIDAEGTSTVTSYPYGKDNLPSCTALTPSARKMNYTYDTLNRLKSTDITLDSPLNIYYNYRVSDRNATGDSFYRTTQLSSELIGLKAYAYVYDAAGNITAVKEGARTDQTETAGTGYVTKITYEYDNLGELTRENNVYTDKTTTWSHDNGGNIVSKKEYAYTTGTLGDAQQSDTYTYNAIWKDRLDNYNGSPITYDAIGNPLSYRGFSLGWSSGRQLTSISGNGITSGSFKYDADGNRSQKKINGATTDYYYVDGKLLAENRDGVEYSYQYDANGNPARITYTNSSGTLVTYYLVCNSRGDVEEIWTGGTAGMSARYYYDAWGNVTSIKDANGKEITSATNVANVNPFRYRGYYYDTETGLYYLGSRYYDPATGRFINADGMVDTGQDLNGANMFAYCGNDPVNREDPSGTIFTLAEANSWYYTNNPKAPDAKTLIAIQAKVQAKQKTKVSPTQNAKTGYSSADNAALAWANVYNPPSIKNNTEMISAIYRTNGAYYYTKPSLGNSDSARIPTVSPGEILVAYIHSHAAYDKRYDNENFSGMSGDIGVAHYYKVPLYVATPGGYLKRYDPSSGKVFTFTERVPWDVASPDR